MPRICAPKSIDVEKSKTVVERCAYRSAVGRSRINSTFSTFLVWPRVVKYLSWSAFPAIRSKLQSKYMKQVQTVFEEAGFVDVTIKGVFVTGRKL